MQDIWQCSAGYVVFNLQLIFFVLLGLCDTMGYTQEVAVVAVCTCQLSLLAFA